MTTSTKGISDNIQLSLASCAESVSLMSTAFDVRVQAFAAGIAQIMVTWVITMSRNS
jgi:hypothetical protein